MVFFQAQRSKLIPKLKRNGLFIVIAHCIFYTGRSNANAIKKQENNSKHPASKTAMFAAKHFNLVKFFEANISEKQPIKCYCFNKPGVFAAVDNELFFSGK